MSPKKRILQSSAQNQTPTQQSKLRQVMTIDNDQTPTQEQYEFQAPKFHDFTQDEQPNDQWFDTHKSPMEQENKLDNPVASRTRSSTSLLSKRHSKSPGRLSKKKKLTVPKPFNLRTDAIKTTVQEPNSPFVSLVNKVAKVMEERSKPVKTKKGPRPLTQPMSPKLSTRLRSKPVKIPTREERELEELQKIKPVKARPLNRKILESNEPLGVPPPMKQPLTIPQSPAIHKPGPKEIEPSPPRIVKANPVPDLSKPFQPQIETRKIVPDEFRLPGEEISQKKRSKIQQKLLEEQEEMEKAKQFHAQPLPQFKDPKLEHKIQVTEPSPFLLETELRGMQKEQQLQKQLLELEQKRKEEAHFKAHPLPKLDPFVPQKSDKPLTEVVDPQLNTEMRAEERKEFDLQIQRRLQDEEEAKQRLLQQQEEEEQERIKQLRKETVHKAQPVKKFAKTVIKPSDKPLTAPMSPMIGDKRKK